LIQLIAAIFRERSGHDAESRGAVTDAIILLAACARSYYKHIAGLLPGIASTIIEMGLAAAGTRDDESDRTLSAVSENVCPSLLLE